MNGKTLVQLAQEFLAEFYLGCRSDRGENGEEFFALKETRALWMEDAVRKAHGDAAPSDVYYDEIHTQLGCLAGQDDDASEEDLRALIEEIEPDAYTSDLTAWLAKDINFVYYITDALTELGPYNDGFALLGASQYLWKTQLANSLLDSLVERMEALADDEDDEDDKFTE